MDREKAIDIIRDIKGECENARDYIGSEACEVAIEALRHNHTQPKKPHGEWILKKDEDVLRTYDLLCSECGHKIFTCENYDSIEEAQKTIDGIIEDGKQMPNYCMMCGSDNRPRILDEAIDGEGKDGNMKDGEVE